VFLFDKLRKAIIIFMARGWESKSVEAQQDEAASAVSNGKPRLSKEDAVRIRHQESLRLALQNAMQHLERAQDPRHRAMLEQAVAELKQKMQALAGAGGMD
jgi:hypothetical protein